MNVKEVERKIPPERENNKDRFRVRYGNKNDFEVLRVTVTRLKTGERTIYEFSSNSLTEFDSIHFSTFVLDEKMEIIWDDHISTKAKRL